MQSRVLIIAVLVLALTAAVSVPRANAEPLTIIAIVGVVTVLSAGSVDMAARSDQAEDTKDMRARQEEAAPVNAGVDTDARAFIAVAPAAATPSVASP